MNTIMTQIQDLIDGNCRTLYLCNDGTMTPYYNTDSYHTCNDGSYYILPTAADPLHKGHLHMANYAQTIRELDISIEFELSISNVDKLNLVAYAVYSRLQQFMKLGRKYWITNFATYVQKAHFFNECQFIIGTDTANRIVDPVYYFDCEEERDKVIEDIAAQGCSFMVLGRPKHVLDDYCFEKNDLFFIEEYEGHDISSTQIKEDLRNHPDENRRYPDGSI